MESTQIPSKFPIPWANSATSPYIRAIPTASQQGVQNGAASLTDGFPPLCFLPISAGGAAPFGEDFNGVIQQLTQWNQWQSAGGPIYYDASFSSAIGGYPAGAVLNQAGNIGAYWVSQIDNNTSDPDTGGANWLSMYQGNRYAWSTASPPSSDISLLVGDKVTITQSATTTLPVRVAVVEGGIYHVLWICTSNNSTNCDLFWEPNNTTYTDAISSYIMEMYDQAWTSFGSATGGAGTAVYTTSPYVFNVPFSSAAYKTESGFYFDLFGGPSTTDTINDFGPYIFDAIAFTNTSGKFVKSYGGDRGGACAHFNLWEDTTTAWTSLGTLLCANGSGGDATCTGVCYIERLA